MRFHFLAPLVITLTMNASMLSASAPKEAASSTVTLNPGNTFSISVEFPDHPQVSNAVSVTQDFLERIGLKGEDSGDLNIHVKKNESIASGGYRLRSDRSAITLEASDAEGARCGLMALLHRIGVRWYNPSDAPLIPTLPLPMENIAEDKTPSFSYRGLHICAVENHYDERLVQWMSFHKMNRKLTHVRQIPQVGDDLAKYGIAPDTTVHSYTTWIPDKKYYASHPEFFSLIGGKRITQKEGGQLCLSNRTMRDAFISEMRGFLDQNPGIATIGVCPNDGYGWCECSECRALDTPGELEAGTVNGRVADFVQQVCAEIIESHPKVLVGHYSYSNFAHFYEMLEEIPPNLMVSCTTFRCHRHAIDDPSCESNSKNFDILQRLSSKVKHVYVYDYLYHNWTGLPQPQWRVLANNHGVYAKLGVDGYMTETLKASSPDFEGGHFSLYVIARQLYDQNETLEDLLNDYCVHRFGPAAKIMQAYYQLWEQAVEEMKGCLARKLGDDLERLMAPRLITEGRQLLSRAAALATGDHRTAVLLESKIFERWAGILKAQKEARAVVDIPVGTMEQFYQLRNGTAAFESDVIFLDRSLKIQPPDNQTRGALYSDGSKLGIIIECEENSMATVRSRSGDTLEAVYGSDNVEIFLRDGKNADVCYHILTSISGGHCASRCEGTQWDWTWKGTYTVQVKRGEDRWRIFFEIPLSAVNSDRNIALTLIRNRLAVPNEWRITGIPNGGVFFNKNAYLEVPLSREK